MSHMSSLRSFMFLKRKLLLIVCSGERMWSTDCKWKPSNDPSLQISENKGQKAKGVRFGAITWTSLMKMKSSESNKKVNKVKQWLLCCVW